MHRVVCHGYANPLRRVVWSEVCPCCGGNFGTRARAIHHISFSAVRCRMAAEEGLLPRVDDATFLELERQDTVARREARKQGVSHILALTPATRHSSL